MFDYGFKSTSRRAVIREKCPDRAADFWHKIRANGVPGSLGIAAVFCALAIAIVMLRDDVIPYRPGQYVPHDILSRVNFEFYDKAQLDNVRRDARNSQPRVYRPEGDFWGELEKNLIALPQRITGKKIEEIDPPLRYALELEGNTGALSELLALAADPAGRAEYEKEAATYVEKLRNKGLVIVPEKDFRDEWATVMRRQFVTEPGAIVHGKESLAPPLPIPRDPKAQEATESLRNTFEEAARVFPGLIGSRIVAYTIHTLKPTYVLDEERTVAAQNRAAQDVPASMAVRRYAANQPIFTKGVITEDAWLVLKAEKQAFVYSIKKAALKARLGMAATVVLLTVVLGWYVGRYQPRIVRNHFRAAALGGLLVSMLLLAQLAAIGSGPLYIFGLAPTIFVAMILAIAYDQRFAIGVASMHGILVTAALDQGIGFFLILWIGVLTSGFLLNEIRTRSKLIETGGLVGLAMMLGTIAAGCVSLDPLPFIGWNCLYTAAAGLGVGFIVLGILPFVEKSFKITTGMTLLELADASQPLLRRLSLEAPGTYNHSLQVATLAEAAADSIGADSLLCRVAAYYHDVGKINKADYFIENQTDGRNRHIHLSASMSFHIIHGHVKDGMALAKEYNLPSVIHPFIQQHHGTTLIEYFFDKAKKSCQAEPDGQTVSEEQFRYAGPKPRTREIAILMLADAAESATRAEREPSHNQIEQLVHRLATARLEDGQFDDCDLTLRELAQVEKTLVKTLTSFYHGRIAYPSNSKNVTPAPKPAAQDVPAGIVA